ncbi:MAG: c-type cytochrome, partial [Candidatus Tectimicrobiota bacterium]
MSRFSVPPGPILGAIMMSGLAFTLIAIVIARSPYTHGNLRPEGYNRTEIAYVGEEPPFEGLGLADPRVASTGDPVQDGRALFFQYGCASCHGLKGQGGAVGLELDLDDLSLVDFHKEVRRGPKGMPAFMEGVLTDEEIDEMYAFLESISEGLPGGEAPPSPEPTPAATPTPPTPAPTPTVAPTPTLATGAVLQAARATITVDGDNSDWAGIAGLSVTLRQPDYTGTDFDVPDPVDPIDAVVKVAIDDQNIYILLEITDDYDFDPADHNFSASPNVMFLIDPAAGPHMGA